MTVVFMTKTHKKSMTNWRALVMERYDIQNQELRDNLAVLFSWEYIPIKENIGDKNVREDIIRDRTEYFGAGTIHSDWASIGEILFTTLSNLTFLLVKLELLNNSQI